MEPVVHVPPSADSWRPTKNAEWVAQKTTSRRFDLQYSVRPEGHLKRRRRMRFDRRHSCCSAVRVEEKNNGVRIDFLCLEDPVSNKVHALLTKSGTNALLTKSGTKFAIFGKVGSPSAHVVCPSSNRKSKSRLPSWTRFLRQQTRFLPQLAMMMRLSRLAQQ